VQREKSFLSRTSSLDAVTRQAETAALARRRSAVRFGVVVALLAGIGTAFASHQRSAAIATRATTTAAPQALTPSGPALPQKPAGDARGPAAASLDDLREEAATHGAPGATGVRPNELTPPAPAAAATTSVLAPTKAQRTKSRKRKVSSAKPQPTAETTDDLAEPSVLREY
jgi:hypothetical protein